MARFYLLILLFIVEKALIAQSYFPPTSGSQWDTLSPQSLGWCMDKTAPLYTFLDSNNSKAFIVLKDGKIVLEKYFGTFTKDSAWYWASAGKTLTAFCVGIANQEGKLKLTDLTSKYLGKGWTSMTQAQEDKVTIWHQLTMTSGMLDSAGLFECTDKSCLQYKADAGTRWSYHNAPYTLLDSVIESATGQNLNAFVNAKIKSVTGMTGLFFKSGYNNVYYSTPRSFARYGLLLMNKGVWNGTDLLKDSNYFKSMTTSSQSLNKSYGYLTWLNGKESFMLPSLQTVFNGQLCPDAPAEMFAALGKNGQIINVIPSQNLVMIRMGNMWTTSNVPNEFNNDIWKRLKQVICSTNATIINNEKEFSMYPNPCTNYINLSSDNAFSNYQITNLLGQKIMEGQSTNSIDVQALTPGFYFLELIDEKSLVIKRKRFEKRGEF
jgi:CubicO group peptidase (beta-lactamase class C family)